MPYNPSSAYPRHSTYTPPVEGRAFARAFNEPRWGQPIPAGQPGPRADVSHALDRALMPGSRTAIGHSMEAMARRGIIARAETALKNKAASDQQRARNIASGLPAPKPLAESSVYPRPEQPEPEFVMNAAQRSRGGRKHVGGINERLGDIAAREESTTAMDQVVDNVVNSTGVGGPAKLPEPVWRRGFSRLRGGT